MFPISLLSYHSIHRLGKFLGTIAYLFGPKDRRKITYNNLALAKDLKLSEKDIKRIAKESYQNLIINSLEFFRLKKSKNKIDHFVNSKNKDPLENLVAKGQGALCVTGHISNWELCFLNHTQKSPASAIGKQIKNRKLYEYILSVREMHGGKIVDMKNAISFAINELKKGVVFSMVNDQAYTSSSYSYPFFGRRAWTSAAPALIAYKANVPLFSVSTTRLPKGRYEYTLSDPIWPDQSKPLKQEVTRLMNILMQDFEKSISKNPGQWLWQHKRWKQEGYNYIWKKYKADSILIILPDDEKLFHWINKDLWIFSQIYKRSFLTYMVPKKYEHLFSLKNEEVLTYETKSELLIRDYRFQLIYDFKNDLETKKHFFKLGAVKYFNLDYFKQSMQKKGLKDLSKSSLKSFIYSTVCLTEAVLIKP